MKLPPPSNILPVLAFLCAGLLLLQLRAIEHSLSVIANKKTVISMPENSVFLLSENEPKALLPRPKWNGKGVKIR